MDLPKEIDIRKLPFFFILGRTRSGTTMLRNMFDAHPNVSIPNEFPFIPFTFSRFGKIKVWDNNTIHHFIVCLSSFKKFANLKISPDQLEKKLQEQRNLITDFSYRDAVKIIACSYHSEFSKKNIQLAGDKSPAYSMIPRRMLKVFPDAKFVVIVRDYRDVVASVKRIDFELPFTSMICLNWKISQRRIFEASIAKPEQFLIIRYEDFVKNASSKLEEICSFLNVEFVPEVFENFNKSEFLNKEFKSQFVERHHKSLKDPVNSTHIEQWRKTLKPIQVRIADHVVGKWAERLGYQRVYKFFNPLIMIASLPGIAFRFFLLVLIMILRITPQRIRGRYWAIGELFAAFYYKLFPLQQKTRK